MDFYYVINFKSPSGDLGAKRGLRGIVPFITLPEKTPASDTYIFTFTLTKETRMIFPIGDEQVVGGHKPFFSYLLIGYTTSVAWWAHIGEFVFGLVAGYIIRRRLISRYRYDTYPSREDLI